MEYNEAKKKQEKELLDHKGRFRDLSDSMKSNDICIIGVPEEERERKGQKFYLRNYS